MKKNLIIAIGLVLIFAHIIPPYNIVFANDDENTCEMSDFTIQTIKEKDEKIVGNGMPSDRLTVVYISKNKTEVVNVNSNGEFELTVEEEALATNDVVTISNEYYKVEIKVASDGAATQTVQSTQYVECPVIEEVPKESIVEEEATEPEEKPEESIVEEEATEPEEKPEESIVEEEATESKEISKNLEVEEEISGDDTEKYSTDIRSMMGIYQSPGLVDVELLNNTTLDATYNVRNDGVSEIRLTYTGSGVLDLGIISNAFSNFYLPSEIVNVIDKSNLRAYYDVPSLGILIPILRNKGEFSSSEINLVNNQVYMNFFSLLSLNLITSAKHTFTLVIELDELPLTETGQYAFHSITSNQLIDLSLISDSEYKTAMLEAPVYPETPVIDSPIYNDSVTVTGRGVPSSKIVIILGKQEIVGHTDEDGNYSITIPRQNVSTEIKAILENSEGYRSREASVTVIKRLEAPTLEDVYSNETQIKGTGEPKKDVEITIGSNTYKGNTDENGNFSVEIGSQSPDTVISAVLIDEHGGKSETAETIVKEGTISFHNVPGTIAFETTEISLAQGEIKISRQNPNWTLEVNDTRRPGSNISILAEEVKPLTTTDGTHTLPGALVYVDNNLNVIQLDQGTEEVFSGTTQAESITSFNWEDNQGILINVDPLTVRPEAYSGTIKWTISNGP